MADRIRVSDLDFVYISSRNPTRNRTGQTSRTRCHGPNVLMV